MRHLSKLILACALVGCATAAPPPEPPKWQTQAEADIKAAQAAGAEQIPAAQDHLAKAQKALAAAIANKSSLQGSMASAEASLAKNLAREAKAKADLTAAINQLNALKAQ
ncbi:MAG TPA: hypothetical protein VEJ89_03645 [Myxococcaceae bacterium]|jgi:outer membrane PBP1 activator LpoA protein|nr:hypothetical protein [Myxococcaceae bacterium]